MNQIPERSKAQAFIVARIDGDASESHNDLKNDDRQSSDSDSESSGINVLNSVDLWENDVRALAFSQEHPSILM